MNVYAYTEPDQRPGYLSINWRGDQLVASLRSRDTDAVSELALPEQERQRLADALFELTPAKTIWHGTFLNEDEIVADMLATLKASDPEAVKR